MKVLVLESADAIPSIENGHVFNSSAFQSLKKGRSLHFILEEENAVVCSVSFRLMGDEAISGYEATFGSFDFVSRRELISKMIEEISEHLRYVGVTKIIVKHWPQGYPDGQMVQEEFLKAGYEIKHSELNQHLIIDEDDFSTHIKKNERKKLNQSHTENYQFRKLSINDLKNVYGLVKLTRRRRGFPVTMKYDDLHNVFDKLPGHYNLFGLFDGTKLIAASVSIRISRQIMYNFYHADDVDYRSRSPLVMLNEGIYNFCREENIKVLDLGISSENGVINEGLFTFKQNLGCVASDKNTYILDYANS